MPAPPEVVFTFAPGQNQFFVELAEALHDGLTTIGVPSRIAEGEYPEPRAGRIYVLLPPHEFVERSGYGPPPEVMARCIGISAEQPTSHFFHFNIKLGRDLGAVFDINPRAIRRYREYGVDAQHLQLGYCDRWDRFANPERDIDVLFMGRVTERRERALALCANAFEPLRVHLQLADGYRPGWRGRPDFVHGEAKLDLLSRAKVLLTVHGEDEPYFEWLRVAEAICAGAMVVTEHSSDVLPLRHGEHLVTGGLERVGLLCAWAVENADERERIRRNAFELLRDAYPLEAAARAIGEAATALDATAPLATQVRTAIGRRNFMAARRALRDQFEYQPSPSPYDATSGRILRTLKEHSLALTTFRRRLDAEIFARSAGPGEPPAPTVRVLYESPGWADGTPGRLAVVVPLYNHRTTVVDALDSVERSEISEWELVVVDDGSTDAGGETVAEWAAARPELRARVVRHEVNRGLSQARNTGTAFTSAPALLMLDADNELRPTAMGRLLAALDGDPDAWFAYGIIERFSVEGPAGLLSIFPWDPQRLRVSNYIDALALVRRSALESMGGYSLDRRLALGWEDYDLWARIAEAGGRGAFIPEIIARYRVGHSSMVSVTNISPTDAYAAVSDHAPTLMRGVQIPH